MSVRTCGFGKKIEAGCLYGIRRAFVCAAYGVALKKRFLIRSGIETDWHSGKKVFFR